MVVGEAPGFHENKEGRPFVGPAGILLDEFLRRAKLYRQNIYVTNVFKYQPPNNDIKRIAEVCNVDEQLELLWREIGAIKPNCILALGNTPLYYLAGKTGISNYVSLRVSAIGGLSKPVFRQIPKGDATPPSAARRGERLVNFDAAGTMSAPVFDRAQLLHGNVIPGPAIVEEVASTTVVEPGDVVKVNEFGHLVIQLGNGM